MKTTAMKLESLPLAPARPIRRAVRWRVPVIVAAVLALGGAAWYANHSGKPAAGDKTAAAPHDGGPPKVDVYELSSGDVAAIEAGALRVNLPLSGTLTPLAQATVKSKASGVVTEAQWQEGTSVAAGQVLARIDQADPSARVAQQQAALDEARARLALATKNNANSLALLKQNYISQSSYDTTNNSVELAQASVKAAQAQLAMAHNALADTVIRAPLAGVISKRHVQRGEKLAPDMPVYSIVDLRHLTLEAQVPASEVPRVKVGQEVQFRVDGYGTRSFAGTVARINPSAEAGSRAMLVYISVANDDSALRAGMFAKGSITTEKSAVRPLLPIAALRRDNNRDVVYKIDGNKVVAQAVTTGLRNDDEGMIEVTEGLKHGERVVLARLDGVKPGSKVKVADAASTAAAAAAAAAGSTAATALPATAKKG